MEYTSESSLSPFDCPFGDPPLYPDEDAYLGDSPAWDDLYSFTFTNPAVPTSGTGLNYSFSVDGADEQHDSGISLDSSPVSGTGCYMDAYTETAYAQDWTLLDPTPRGPRLPSSAGRFAPPESPPARRPLAPATDALSPASSQGSTVGPAKVAIQRERARHPKAGAKVRGASDARHHCAVARCRKSFSRQSDLHRHNLDVHSRAGKHYECDVPTCYYTSRRADKVKEHCQKMHHQLRGCERFSEVVDRP